MPFAYYGAKHKLAPSYDLPLFDTIIEPFAGSAAYSCLYAAKSTKVILIEKDLRVVDLWHELQEMTCIDLDRIESQLADKRCTHPLIGGIAGSSTLSATLNGKDRAVTPRMKSNWPPVRRRIESNLDKIKSWQIIPGSYIDAPDIEATWLIDPPYQPFKTMAGAVYRESSENIDYKALGEWCSSRSGQIMVCEQQPAAWLPFTPHASQTNAIGDRRVEVLWKSGLEQSPSLF